MNGNCPNFATQAAGIVAVAGQDVVISRIEFVNDGARVTVRGTGAGNFDLSFNRLCSGPDLENDCITYPTDFDSDDSLSVGEELFAFIDDLDPASGELAIVNPDELVLDDAILFAYVAWGEESTSALETAAVDGELWTAGDFVEVDGDNTIYGSGATDDDEGYGACIGDGDSFD